jgi:predicted nucleotidyltransferase
VLREDFRPDSDVDVLVVFEPGHVPGWDIVQIEDDLSSLVGGRRVDLITEDSLNRRIRTRVLQEAEVQYVGEG